jgi:hypothetical protein
MSDGARSPTAILGAALALTCWPVWWLAGMLAGLTGMGDFDLVVRVVAIFAFLTLIDTLSGNLIKT